MTSRFRSGRWWTGFLLPADCHRSEAEVSPQLARIIGIGCEKIWGVLRLSGEPPMTRFVANELSTAHWFDISAAKRDLGYYPEVSIEEGLKRLREWLPTSGLLAEKR